MREDEMGETTREWRVLLTAQELAAVEFALVDFSMIQGAPENGRVEARCVRSALSKIARATRAPNPTHDLAGSLSAMGSKHQRQVTLDEPALTITIFGEPFVCKPTGFRTLSRLIQESGQWIRADVLARDVLGVCFQKGASNLRWHVLQARRTLGAHGVFLHGDNRLGYMFDLVPCSRKHCGAR
jgi:DNA-binding response OmpR family regulator